jgi:acetoin utilization deacetylase AcuC-like enzyme
MTTLLVTNSDSLAHHMPRGHPEQVGRYEAIMAALSASDFDTLIRHDAPEATLDDILLAHPESHFAAIRDAIPDVGSVALDADTHVTPGSWVAALRGVGGNLAAVDQVLAGTVTNAFVATRPPGHHAETTTPMGFCLFGNIALAAKHAMERHGLTRVAIVDFDVHHGNGTQDLLWSEDRCLFISSHQMPLYPGSGAAHETGASHNVLNIPLAPDSGSAQMRRAYEQQVFPALDNFRPELILVSAGFDAHTADPLANLNWTTEDFAWVTGQLCDLAQTHCDGRLVSTLEGGYDLPALAESVAAHVKVLMERS